MRESTPPPPPPPPADNFILAREFRRERANGRTDKRTDGRARILRFFFGVCNARANPAARMESRAIRRNDITCHKFCTSEREREREGRGAKGREIEAVTLEHRPMCQTCVGLARGLSSRLHALMCARCGCICQVVATCAALNSQIHSAPAALCN